MRVMPLFSGVFSIVRQNKERNRAVLKTALKQADKYGFRVADDSNSTHIKLETISRANDRLLKDAFTKSGIQFKYSKAMPASHALRPLGLGERIDLFFSRMKGRLHSSTHQLVDKLHP